MLLKRLHFYGGITLLLIFFLSGHYMDSHYQHLQGMEDLKRMIFRTEHIYLLLSSLIHISLGTYFTPFSHKGLTYLQVLASLLMFTASILFIVSFFRDMPTDILERSLSRMGLYLMLAGVVAHGIFRLVDQRLQK